MRQWLWAGRGGKKGFTIVEAVISTTLLAMAMGGSYVLVSRTLTNSKVARNHYVASALSKNRIERARNFRYVDLVLLKESKVVVDANGNPNAAGDFRRTTEVYTNYAPGLTEVRVMVDVKNVRTGIFDSIPLQCESNSCLFTEY